MAKPDIAALAAGAGPVQGVRLAADGRHLLEHEAARPTGDGDVPVNDRLIGVAHALPVALPLRRLAHPLDGTRRAVALREQHRRLVEAFSTLRYGLVARWQQLREDCRRMDEEHARYVAEHRE